MAFDLEGALKEGYSYSEIADHLSSQSDFDLDGARKEGYSDEDIVNHLSGKEFKQQESVNVESPVIVVIPATIRFSLISTLTLRLAINFILY